LPNHKALYPVDASLYQGGEPERVFAMFSKDGKVFDPHIASADIGILRGASKKIIHVVNHEIVHHDKVRAPELTWKEIEACIKVVCDILQKYYLLFTGSSIKLDYITQEPWEWIFTQKWIAR